MRRPARGTTRPRRARGLPLLVLTVLAGVLAMHGLAPVAMTAVHSAHTAPAPAHVMPAGARDCAQPDHESGGHLDHADGTCAAAGTSTGPALPALALSSLSPGLADPAIAPRQPLGTAPDDRAPPSLSQLQLLRI